MVTSIPLHEFIEGLRGLPRQGAMPANGVRLMLDGRGPKNSHLALPTGEQRRKNPLSLDERVYGDYLLLTDTGHDPSVVLTEHYSLDELQSEIIGPAGSLNMWTDGQFVFYKLKPLPFSIQYTDVSGRRKTFNIEQRERIPEEWKGKRKAPPDMELYHDVEFKWGAWSGPAV